MIAVLCALLLHCAAPALAPPAEPPAEAAPVGPEQLPPEVAGDEGQPVSRDAAPPVLPSLPPPAVAVAPPHPDATAPAHPAGQERPAWRRYAMPAPAADGKPTLSIIIDDMGLNAAQSARALALPAAVTLSWLPYAPHVTEQAAAGTARGHETMVHMPMEALGRTFPGPDALRTWLPPAANLEYLRAALDLLPTAVALNQHEGSVASLSVPLMQTVMAELGTRGLAFLDSLTIPHSVALQSAQAAGIPALARDVFLDNDPNPAAIRARLAEAELIARHYGHAVAIGHPRPSTMDVLERELAGSQERGFVLWPISALIALHGTVQLSAAPPPPAPPVR